MSAASFSSLRLHKSALLRLGLLLLASGLLHWLLLHWAAGELTFPVLQHEEQKLMVAQLHPPLPELAAAKAVQPARKAAPKKRNRPPRPAPVAPAAAAAPLPTPSAAGSVMPDDSASTVAATSAQPELTETAAEAAAGDAAEVDSMHALRLPPPADLDYEVQALRDGHPVYGHGSIRWRNDGSHYTVAGEAGVLFFSVLDFHSSGEIGSNGVAPLLYSEKRFRRAQTNTHFQRERNLISFSASGASYPRRGDEQDRASVIWQLASLGASKPDSFAPGTQFDIFVAGVRNGENWRIQVLGLEQIDSGIGVLQVWHLQRMPQTRSYDQQLDIWLAPERHWYPVKLRFTENNGEYLDMTVSDLSMAQTEAQDGGDAYDPAPGELPGSVAETPFAETDP